MTGSICDYCRQRFDFKIPTACPSCINEFRNNVGFVSRDELTASHERLQAANADLLRTLEEITGLFNEDGKWIGGAHHTKEEMLPRWRKLIERAGGSSTFGQPAEATESP